MKTRYYKSGAPVDFDGFNVSCIGESAILSVELNDGRTIQLRVDDKGKIELRGWGNIPGKVGNMDNVYFSATLNFQEPNSCEICYNRLEDCAC